MMYQLWPRNAIYMFDHHFWSFLWLWAFPSRPYVHYFCIILDFFWPTHYVSTSTCIKNPTIYSMICWFSGLLGQILEEIMKKIYLEIWHLVDKSFVTANQQISYFLDPTTQSFCWHNIWMVSYNCWVVCYQGYA